MAKLTLEVGPLSATLTATDASVKQTVDELYADTHAEPAEDQVRLEWFVREYLPQRLKAQAAHARRLRRVHEVKAQIAALREEARKLEAGLEDDRVGFRRQGS